MPSGINRVGLVIVYQSVHVSACAMSVCVAVWHKMEALALHRELRFRGFPYGSDALRSVCTWATSIGHNCLDDFRVGEPLVSMVGADAIESKILRYIDDVLKVLSCSGKILLAVRNSYGFKGTPGDGCPRQCEVSEQRLRRFSEECFEVGERLRHDIA